ncbi:C40 family peptidase [Luteipulveratus halotolerans]|uniref:C40 family peptidase n=1 Tax=Luteipulveratus halotolerans TaxID=1631356 RepID=UPI0006805CA6|nr:NlpC/P60 family protein [Luteipulveratus halotolerans]
MTYAPRHRKAEPSLAASVITGRHGKVLTGVALAVPTAVAGLSAPADAATAPVAQPAQAATAAQASQAAQSVAGVAATAAALPTHYAGGVYVLHHGHSGSLVKTVQKRIGGLSVDGSFGPKTRAAVKSFQGRKGLTRDGYVGPKTWRALGGYPGGSASTTSTRDTSTTASRSTTGSSTNARAAQIAYRYLGIPYVYGGSTPSQGFDCSGLTSYVFRQVGKDLPRTARAQQAAVRRVSSPQVGDLVFYGYPAHHVGIYVGNGQMIDAPKPGTRVNKRAVYQPEVSSYGRP